MKNILLATTAIVAFAGAAAAEVSFSGEAVLGYTTLTATDDFYSSIDIDVTMSQELNNGLTAAASFGFKVSEDFGTSDFDADDVEFSLSSDTMGLYVGVNGGTSDATETVWSGVTNMDNDGFYESADNDDDVLRAEATFGETTLVVGYNLSDEDFDLGVSGSFGDVTVGAVYEEDGSDNNFGLFGSTVLGGASVSLAYAKVSDESSTGVEVTYPVGDVSLTAFYVSQSDVDDNYGVQAAYSANGVQVTAWFHDGNDEDFGLDLQYAVSDVLSVYAGTSDTDDSYLAATYDLGGGASVLASYGSDKSNDEIGPEGFKGGVTVELTLAF